ncbi:MAG: trypsin-like serine peptidase [Candidatus Odinarchaeota archaeon]
MPSDCGLSLEALGNHDIFDKIVHLAKSVVQINMRKHLGNDRYGTGFFICRDPPILITAKHVLPTEKTIASSYIRFNYDSKTRKKANDDIFNLNEGITPFISNKLDCTFIKFRESSNLDFNVAKDQGSSDPCDFLSGLSEEQQSISIIHHPGNSHKLIATRNERCNYVQGNPLNVRLWFAELKIFDHKLLRDLKDGSVFVYWGIKAVSNAPFWFTRGGSSGAPVFNHDWKLIGMHTCGGADISCINKKTGIREQIKDFISVGIPYNSIKKDLEEYETCFDRD